MIAAAIHFIADEANKYLIRQIDPGTDPSITHWVTPGNIVKFAESDSGTGSSGGSNDVSRIIVTVVNIEEDKLSKSPENFERTNDNRIVYRNPKIFLNLYVVFSAINKSDYETALSDLSLVIQCFQHQRVFEPAYFPTLDTRIERLAIDLFSLNFEQINHLWSTLGGKYTPSVLYKLRVISIEDTTTMEEGAPIKEIDLNGKSVIRL